MQYLSEEKTPNILYSVSSQLYRKHRHQKRIKKNKPKCYDDPLALKSKNMDAFIIVFILFRIGPIFFKFVLFLHLKK